MDLAEIMQHCPHLASPAHLAVADRDGKYATPEHLLVLNSELMNVAFSGGGSRLRVHMPFQHGKTWLASNYYPAWRLLLFPDARIGLVAHAEGYAEDQGGG